MKSIAQGGDAKVAKGHELPFEPAGGQRPEPAGDGQDIDRLFAAGWGSNM